MVDKKKTLTTYSTRANEIRAQVNMIQEVMESVMKKDIHYGIIPGCKKPSLLKPGAEKILMTFHLVADNPIIEDLSTEEYIRYRVTQRILTPKGELMGAASGECSSDEDKYKWRRPVCDEEFKDTPEDRRMEKWVKDNTGKAIKIKRIRTNPADVGNTILKMAVKRAVVAATLITTAASDVFDQDIEDLPPEILNNNETLNHKPAVTMPQPTKQKPKEQENAEEIFAASEVDNALNVLDALQLPIGETFDVWGVLFEFKTRQVNTKKGKSDITDYKISPRESTELLEISKWGKAHENIANGDVVKFSKVVVSEYRNEKKYLAQEIEILEKANDESTE